MPSQLELLQRKQTKEMIDLFTSRGFSVDDGIFILSTLSYASVNHLASLLLSCGREALLVKAYIKKAYRMIPIHPYDQHLSACWNGCVYIVLGA